MRFQWRERIPKYSAHEGSCIRFPSLLEGWYTIIHSNTGCCCWVASVVSDSVWPHRRQPTRPRCPWDSPGKNTGVGCHFLLQCMKVKSESEVAQSCPTLSDPMDCSPPGSSVHGRRSIFISSVHFLGRSTGVGCHCLLLPKATNYHYQCFYILPEKLVYISKSICMFEHIYWNNSPLCMFSLDLV